MSSSPPGNGSLGKTDVWLQPVVTKQSLHEAAKLEADKHKWIQSQKAGYDLGEGCIQEWVREHWTGYLRERWVEHLQGKHFWIELEHRDFGLLQREFHDSSDLLNSILDQLKSGKENLNVICWAVQSGIPTESVQQILFALNLNSLRLKHRFDRQ